MANALSIYFIYGISIKVCTEKEINYIVFVLSHLIVLYYYIVKYIFGFQIKGFECFRAEKSKRSCSVRMQNVIGGILYFLIQSLVHNIVLNIHYNMSQSQILPFLILFLLGFTVG